MVSVNLQQDEGKDKAVTVILSHTLQFPPHVCHGFFLIFPSLSDKVGKAADTIT